MNKVILTAIGILICTLTYGQQKIVNKLTTEHIYIAGTKISMIPPDGFSKASNFFGFQQAESGSSIMILDIPGPFGEATKGFTKEGLLSKGVVVKNMKKLLINGLPALLITGEQSAYGSTYTKYILAFGNEEETIIINGISPNDLKEIGKSVKTAILSVFYEANKVVNPLENVDFTIDVSKSKLKFGKSLANSLMFSVNGEVPTQSADKTFLIVGKSFSKIDIEDKKLFSLNNLKQIPSCEIEEAETINEISIDGISGYEILAMAKNKDTGLPEKVYQVILFSDDLYYIFIGLCNENFEENIAEIRQVISTFKRK